MKRSCWTKVKNAWNNNIDGKAFVGGKKDGGNNDGQSGDGLRRGDSDNGATTENALEETNVLGGNPIPKIKTGPELEALAKAMAKARARVRAKGAREDK